jgi:hypothetical protein
MGKKPPPKQPTERGSFNKTFPFELVKSLQRQFEIAGKEYPGLAHVLVLRSEAKGDEQLDEKALKAEFEADEKLGQAVGTFQDFLYYKRMNRGIFPFERAHPRPGARIVLPDPTPSSNVCQFWQYGSGLEYKVGMSGIHFLCQTRGECWNKEKATQRFLSLMEPTRGLLAEPIIVNYINLSKKMQHLPYAVDLWLIALHQCGLAKVYDPMLPKNLFYLVADLLLPITDRFLRSGRCAYLGAVPDVWLALTMLYAEFLDLPEKQTQKQPGIEYSRALPMSKWADILGFSEKTLGNLSETYHFHQVSDRRWSLPKHELPAEYLEKYRGSTRQNYPNSQ